MGVPSFYGSASRSGYPAAVRRARQSLAQNTSNPSGDVLSKATTIVSAPGAAWTPLAATDHTITWTAPDFDTGPYWSAGAPTHMVVPATGYYFANLQVDYTSVGTDTGTMTILQNGTLTVGSFRFAVVVTTPAISLLWSGILQTKLTAGDILTGVVNMAGGGEVIAGSRFSIEYLGS